LPAEAPAKAGAPTERHGGAPKGERAFRGPSATYAPRLTRAAHSRRKARQRQEDAPVGAPPTPRREREDVGCLIVRWDDTATVRRRAASSAALIRPHAQERACASAPKKWNVRARVSKGEDEQLRSPSCFETHRGAVQLWNDLRSCRAAMLLSMRARPRAEHQPAAVRNHRRHGFIVSGLLFTMNFATAACRPRRAFISLHAAPDRAATRPRAVELPPSCAPARRDPCRECGIRSHRRR
jgi:hypothetical protein